MPPRKRFYAILRGRETGVFNSWQEVEVHVKGFRGAIYQSFGNWDDAQAYLNSAISITDNTPTPPSPTPPSFSDPINDPGVEQSTNIHGLFDTDVAMITVSPNRARASVNMSDTTHNLILVAHPSLACNSDTERIKNLYASYITPDGSCQGKSGTIRAGVRGYSGVRRLSRVREYAGVTGLLASMYRLLVRVLEPGYEVLVPR